jgi:proline dehydrogenase
MTALSRLAASRRFERTVRAVPAAERLAWRAASRYFAGETPASAIGVARDLRDRGVGSSLDLFGEEVEDTLAADRVTADYLELAGRVNGLPAEVWLSVDPSHLGLRADPAGCADRLAAITARLSPGRRVQVGAEEYGHADAILGCVESVAGRGLADRLGATVQANFRRAPRDADRLAAVGVYIRLVKGAYPGPADLTLPFGEPAGIAYVRLAHQLAGTGAQFSLATHDGVLREALFAALGPRPVEQHLGVRPDVVAGLTARGIPVRLYVPFGPSWFRYWMRRAAESRRTIR